MGGTEIYPPLSFILETPLLSGLARNIFLITDGAVTNTSSVLELIKRNAESINCFSLGIGSGASAELITGAADLGHGVCEFVSDSNMINDKVISLLKSSLAKKC